MKKILILKALPPGGLSPAALPQLTLELHLGRPSPSRPPPRKSKHDKTPTGHPVCAPRGGELPRSPPGPGAGNSGSGEPLRPCHGELRRPLGCPPRAHLLRSLPSRASPPAERADSRPPAGPRETTTRVGRFPGPRSTRCPPSNSHGRPLVRFPVPSGGGRGPAAPRGHVPSSPQSRRCRLHP